MTNLANGNVSYYGKCITSTLAVGTSETRVLEVLYLPLSVSIIGPANGTVSGNPNVNFSIIASSGMGLANATLNIYNLTGLYNRTFVNLGGVTQATVGIVVWLADGVIQLRH